jgi:DNA invertase Pin-like site-specific DNA recombinase
VGVSNNIGPGLLGILSGVTTTPAPAEGDLLAPIPLAGVLVGYGRVSTREQNLARQQAALSAAGCAKCFFDKASGKNTDRPELHRMFDYVRPGDVLTVVSLDRLGRSLEDLIGIVGRLKRQGVGFQSLHEKLDTTTAGGVFVFHVFAALAEFIRTIIVGNTNEGLAAARARGQRLGRPPAMTPEKIAYALQLLAEPDRTMSAIAKMLGISRSTLYKMLPELVPPAVAQQRLDAQIAALPVDTRPGPPSVISYDALLRHEPARQGPPSVIEYDALLRRGPAS